MDLSEAMIITKDFRGPYGSARYIALADDCSVHVYEGKEASALAILLARKIDPDIVLNALRELSHD